MNTLQEKRKAKMNINEQISTWFENREDEFVAALTPLIAVDSTIGEPAPGAPFGTGPAKALKTALALAESWGLTTGEDEGYVGTADLNDKPDQLHILAHMDVVGIGDGWNTDPFTLVRDGDLIYGRGVDDDKGPAVAAMMAMRCVKELGLPLSKNVKLVLGTDEETGSRDIAHYYAHHPYAPNSVTPDSDFPVTNIEKARYAPTFSAQFPAADTTAPHLVSIHGGIRVNVAPGECRATVAGLNAAECAEICKLAEHNTGVSFTLMNEGDKLMLVAHGAEAHASTPDEGKNAISALLSVLCALPLEETPALVAARQLHSVFPFGDNAGKALGIAHEDEVSGKLTLTFSVLDLDDKGFSGQFDVRAPLCATKENCSDVVEQKFAGFGWSCTGTMSQVHMVDANSDFIRTLLDSYEHFSGKKGYCEAIGGGTYVHEIPGGVAFGAGDRDFESRLHGANERARLSQLLLCGKIYASMIAGLCK